MIFRRFIENIRAQSWFAVSVDLIVLVVGIFLGLQVDNWNEQRIERLEEREYLERMLQDADNSIEAQKQIIEVMNDRIGRIARLTEMLLENQVSENNLDEFTNLYQAVGPWSNLQFFQDTIDEMISAGKLTTLRSVEFRNKLSRFRDTIRNNNNSVGNIGFMLMNVRDRMGNLVKWSPYIDNIEDNPDYLLTQIDQSLKPLTSPDEINNNDELYNYVNDAARSYAGMYRVEMRFHAQSIEFREDIAQALEEVQ